MVPIEYNNNSSETPRAKHLFFCNFDLCFDTPCIWDKTYVDFHKTFISIFSAYKMNGV